MPLTPPAAIRPLPLPESVGTTESAAFEEMVAVMNGVAFSLWGNDDFVYSAEAELTSYRAAAFHEKLVFVAVVSGAIVGRVVVDFPLEQDALTATLLVDVVPSLRGRGIGAALLAKGEELAAEGGRTVVAAYTEHPVAGLDRRGERVRAAVGSSSLPASSPDVRFALAHGYRLGQIERSSSLSLPVPPERAERLLRDARARSAGYRTMSWWAHAPAELVDDFARLKERMTVDVPQSGIVLDDEEWTAERVRGHEDEFVGRGEPILVTAAQHIAGGRLVAYTEIAVPDDGSKAEQLDTLVAGPHRGHRLGTLVKAENLTRLDERAPHIRRLLTWNADENGPMIAVNEAFGFQPYALTGSWQKSLG